MNILVTWYLNAPLVMGLPAGLFEIGWAISSAILTKIAFVANHVQKVTKVVSVEAL